MNAAKNLPLLWIINWNLQMKNEVPVWIDFVELLPNFEFSKNSLHAS